MVRDTHFLAVQLIGEGKIDGALQALSMWYPGILQVSTRPLCTSLMVHARSSVYQCLLSDSAVSAPSDSITIALLLHFVANCALKKYVIRQATVGCLCLNLP